MKPLIKWGLIPLKIGVIFSLLTVLTQVGGIIYVVYRVIKKPMQRFRPHFLAAFFYNRLLFCFLYLGLCLGILPLLSPLVGRVALPGLGTTQPLQARNWVYILANRHYVRPSLKEILIAKAHNLRAKYPGLTLYYLDAGFPFGDGFPLLPHLSHDDGRKVDITFVYRDPKNGKIAPGSPSYLGYGAYEGPLPKESNFPAYCEEAGYWQYSFPRIFNWGQGKGHYQFAPDLTRDMILELAQSPQIERMYLEPHLKTRLGLQHISKIAYHGCHAARHDDHLHLQVY